MSGHRSSRGVALAVVEPPKSEMLRRLDRREITLDEYLDHCAEEAIEHIKGFIDSERLQFLKTMIRDQIRTDPVLVRYVEQATGLTPEADKLF